MQYAIRKLSCVKRAWNKQNKTECSRRQLYEFFKEQKLHESKCDFFKETQRYLSNPSHSRVYTRF